VLSFEEKAERLQAILLKTFGDEDMHRKKVGFAKLTENWSERQKESIRKHQMRQQRGRNPCVEVEPNAGNSSALPPDGLYLDALSPFAGDRGEACASQRHVIEMDGENGSERPRPATSAGEMSTRPSPVVEDEQGTNAEPRRISLLASSGAGVKQLEIGLPSPLATKRHSLGNSFGNSLKRSSPTEGFSQLSSMVRPSSVSRGADILSPDRRPASKNGLSASASAGSLSLVGSEILSPDRRPAAKNALSISASAGSLLSLPSIDFRPKPKNSSRSLTRKERYSPNTEPSIHAGVVGSACKFMSPS
jgi:hypothetical protein